MSVDRFGSPACAEPALCARQDPGGHPGHVPQIAARLVGDPPKGTTRDLHLFTGSSTVAAGRRRARHHPDTGECRLKGSAMLA